MAANQPAQVPVPAQAPAPAPAPAIAAAPAVVQAQFRGTYALPQTYVVPRITIRFEIPYVSDVVTQGLNICKMQSVHSTMVGIIHHHLEHYYKGTAFAGTIKAADGSDVSIANVNAQTELSETYNINQDSLHSLIESHNEGNLSRFALSGLMCSQARKLTENNTRSLLQLSELDTTFAADLTRMINKYASYTPLVKDLIPTFYNQAKTENKFFDYHTHTSQIGTLCLKTYEDALLVGMKIFNDDEFIRVRAAAMDPSNLRLNQEISDTIVLRTMAFLDATKKGITTWYHGNKVRDSAGTIIYNMYKIAYTGIYKLALQNAVPRNATTVEEALMSALNNTFISGVTDVVAARYNARHPNNPVANQVQNAQAQGQNQNQNQNQDQNLGLNQGNHIGFQAEDEDFEMGNE